MATDLLSLSQCDFNYSQQQILRASIVSIFKNIALHIGHTCYPFIEVYKKLTPIFPELTVDSFKAHINKLADDKYIVKINSVGALYLLAKQEHESLTTVASRNKQASFALNLDVIDSKLDHSQIQALKVASNNNICIINGPPGAGKSTVIKNIIDAALAAGMTKDDIVLTATISKAAKRIGHPHLSPPQTVHMAFGVKDSNELDRYIVGDTTVKKVNKKLVVIDECSFLDLALFSRLLFSLPDDCKIVLVGDENQLAPVGLGFVFRDLLKRNTPSVTLTGSYRSTDGIKCFSRKVIDNQFHPLETFNNVDYLWTNSDEEILKAIKRYVPRLIIHHKIDYIDDIQILAPTHKNTVGTLSLNEAIQSKVNPDALSKYRMDHAYFKVNDKVMFTKNSYRNGISNGDLGVITNIENNNDEMIFNIATNNKMHYISEESMINVALAYASTIHKFNGCELDVVVIAIPHEFISILTKNEIYSAITRAKKQVVIIGSQDQFMQALSKSSKSNRLTQTIH